MNIASRPWDVAAVLAYMAAMLGLGLYLARRASAAENYFVGRRDFPGWAVALSMLGTIISSTTFLALPAAAYVLDWRQLTVNLVVPPWRFWRRWSSSRSSGGRGSPRPSSTSAIVSVPSRGSTARWASFSCS